MGLWILIIAAAVMGAGSARESSATAESTTQASRAEDALDAGHQERGQPVADNDWALSKKGPFC